MRTILSMPVVLSKMSLVPEDEDGPWAGEDMRTALLATIRVPHMFGMGGRPAGLNLPVRTTGAFSSCLCIDGVCYAHAVFVRISYLCCCCTCDCCRHPRTL